MFIIKHTLGKKTKQNSDQKFEMDVEKTSLQ